MINLSEFANKKALYEYLRENKQILLTAKRASIKQADAVNNFILQEANKIDTIKEINEDVNIINAELVINTTNILDSHYDVHLQGIWNKTLKNRNSQIYLLEEHKISFRNIISDKIKAYTKTISWSDLGYSYNGTTQALIFNATIEKQRNPYMFSQYTQGFVKNHSVGMQYVKIDLAINSEDKFDVEEKKIWDKYINQIANKEEAEELGFFFAVFEAKLIEGSAVPLGSNFATPVLNIEEVKNVKPLSTYESKPQEITLSEFKKQFSYYLNN